MIISFKDCLKLIGIIIVCFCAVFVCTFFLNFYLDALPIADNITTEFKPLYDAQIATAKITCAISGGVLALVSAIMLIFYIKIYIDEHSQQLGMLKALGYSNRTLAKSFCIFGISVFTGCILGYGFGHLAMPLVYKGLTIEGAGINIEIHYHWQLILFLVIIPSAVFAIISYIYAYFTLRRPALKLIKNIRETKIKNTKDNAKTFMTAMIIQSVSGKKILTFFVAFSCFCFSAMIQMSYSMENLTSKTMSWMIFAIGIVLAFTSAFMAMTSLIKNNSKNIAMMKVFGYSEKECAKGIFLGFVPFAILGFALGTIYQFGLLSIMVNVVFKDVANVPLYSFNWKGFGITFAAFIITYSLTAILYVCKLNKMPLKEIMSEN